MDVDQVIALAKEIEAADPIDWSGLPLHRSSIYSMLGLSVLEQAQTTDSSEREIIMMASLVKLTVENFVLEIRLQSHLMPYHNDK
jgi:hypothetical protein